MFLPFASTNHHIIEVSVDDVSTEILINPNVERVPRIPHAFLTVLLYLVLRHVQADPGSCPNPPLHRLVPLLNVLSETGSVMRSSDPQEVPDAK